MRLSEICASLFYIRPIRGWFHINPRIALHPKITSLINCLIFPLSAPEKTEVAKMTSSGGLVPKHRHMTVFWDQNARTRHFGHFCLLWLTPKENELIN
jgi:hypothetical protein